MEVLTEWKEIVAKKGRPSPRLKILVMGIQRSTRNAAVLHERHLGEQENSGGVHAGGGRGGGGQCQDSGSDEETEVSIF